MTMRRGEDPGRLVRFDERSRQYQIRELLDEQPSRTRSARHWIPGPTLDQGEEGQCVAEACHDRRNGRPLRRRPLVVEWNARRDFYWDCQRDDSWPGGSYPGATPRYEGTSVLAGMREGKRRGWWQEYRWVGAGSGRLEDDIIDTLRGIGGIILGIPWMESMYDTNPDGIVEIDGEEVGGHAIHAFAWVPRLRRPRSFVGTRPAVAWHNSWGDSYGTRRYWRTGVGFILLDDLLTLMERDGEGAVPLGG